MLPVAQLVHQCAPFVAPSTMAAIVQVESGGRALVILDNTTGRDYNPPTVVGTIFAAIFCYRIVSFFTGD